MSRNCWLLGAALAMFIAAGDVATAGETAASKRRHGPHRGPTEI